MRSASRSQKRMAGLSSSKKPRVWAEASRGSTATPCLPHEMVTEILARLPVKSLLRFRSVCKAWRSTISDDPSFVRAHLKHQPATLLIYPCLGVVDDDDTEYRRRAPDSIKESTSIALYRWAPRAGGDDEQAGIAASLVHAVDMPPERCREQNHILAPCDGLVLVPTLDRVHLLNPAARQVVTLPWSPGGDAPPLFPIHQAFGLGRDPGSGTYKVARFFYRQVYVPPPSSSAHARGTYGLTTGVEVFTVGADRHWREIAAQPPFPVIPERTATFVKGSLLWTADERAAGGVAAPGFLRLSLEDETLGVTSPPPCRPRLDYARCILAELRGQLCVARMLERVLELWMSEDAVRPRWERRYAISIADPARPARPRPVALFDHRIVLHDDGYTAYAYDLRTRDFKEMARLNTLDYRSDHPSTAAIADGRSAPFSQFFLIPYRESLVSVHHHRN